MGKITFRRVVHVMHSYYLVASLPVLGSLLFFLGCFFFLPGTLVLPWLVQSAHLQHIIGATFFLLGSVFFLVAPLLDFFDLQFNLDNLAEHPSLTSPVNRYEYLYKATLVHIQRANTILYTTAGICFVTGSVMFYPNPYSSMWYTHGVWLYIAGCLLSGIGALIALLTAVELLKTSVTSNGTSQAEPLLCWPHLSDESATILSCSMYLGGDVLFVVGSLFFFPDVLRAVKNFHQGLQDKVEDGAIAVFCTGSIIFLVGASVDLALVIRAGHRKPHDHAEHQEEDTRSLQSPIAP